MAHYFESGFSVGKPMWHGLGTVADRYPADWAEAREWAGMQWEPVALDTLSATLPNGQVIDLPDHRLIVRNDNWSPLGIVSDEHELVSHGDMGLAIQAVVDQGFQFETGLVLKGGRWVTALLKLDEPFVVKGDENHPMGPVETYPYMAFLNCHSGEGAFLALYTNVRVVCWNTASAAMADANRHGHQFKFSHRQGVKAQVEAAKEVLAGVRRQATEWQELTADLHDRPADDAALQAFVEQWSPLAFRELKKGETELPERSKEFTSQQRSAFKRFYLDGITNTTQTGTALGLLDAAVEFLDHHKGTEAGRFQRFLTGDPRKGEALKLVRTICPR